MRPTAGSMIRASTSADIAEPDLGHARIEEFFRSSLSGRCGEERLEKRRGACSAEPDSILHQTIDSGGWVQGSLKLSSAGGYSERLIPSGPADTGQELHSASGLIQCRFFSCEIHSQSAASGICSLPYPLHPEYRVSGICRLRRRYLFLICLSGKSIP